MSGWTLQPATGTTNLKTLTKVSDLEWWMACRTLGVRHSVDGMQTWVAENAGLVTGADCTEVYNTAYGPILMTVTGVYCRVGGSWVKSLAPVSTSGCLVERAGELIVMSLTSGQGWRTFASLDGGGSFFMRAIAAVFFGIGGTMFLDSLGRIWVTSEADGTWRSLDGGVTFQRTNTLQQGQVCNGPGFWETPNGTILYFGQAHIYRWDEATKVWGLSQTGWVDADTMTRAMNVGNSVYIATEHARNGVYRSTDQGLTWAPYNEVPPPIAQSNVATARYYGLRLLIDGRLVIALRGGQIYKSVDPVSEVNILPPPPPSVFTVTVEGNVHFTGGVGPTHDGFEYENGTVTDLDAYVAAHYTHV